MVQKTVCIHIKPLRENECGIDHRDAFLRNMSSLKTTIDFRVVGNNTMIKLYMTCDATLQQYIENIFYASFPTSELNTVSTKLSSPHMFLIPHQKSIFHDETIFNDTTVFTKNGTYMSPFHDILSLYNAVDTDSELTICLSLLFGKTKSVWSKALTMATKLFIPYNKNSTKKEDTLHHDNPSPHTTNHAELWMRIGRHIRSKQSLVTASIHEQIKTMMKAFIAKGKCDTKKNPPAYTGVMRSQAVHFFHLPTAQHFTKALDYAVYRKLPYAYPLPTSDNTPKDEFTLIGTTDYRNDRINFGMIEEDKFRHMYVVGKTGTGKSTFLSNLIANDIKNGKGVWLLDPHGELVETVLEHIPPHRTNDVILFDVADSDFPIGFNLLQCKDADERIRVVSGVVTTFAKLFAHSRWPRLEYILRNILLTLVDYPNTTLMHILRVLTDRSFREEVLKHCKDTLILKFRRDEYDKRDEKQKQEAMSPITNKIGQFLSSTVVRNIFGQPKSKLNLREAMDNKKIVLINLSKGKIGEDNAAMIGSLLVTKFQIDAMSRSDIKAEQRVPFYLYIDEFQNFATDSFATILSEARKYKLSLIMANQYIAQLLETIRDAIFGNIGSIFSFTVGYDDAKVIAAQFKELVTPNDLISLPRFTAYTRMMINGVTSDPFSMKTMPLPTPEWSGEQTKKIIEQSRQRYAMTKWDIEKLLDAWSKKTFSPAESVALRGKLEGQGIPPDMIQAFFDSGDDSRELWYTENKGNYSPPLTPPLPPYQSSGEGNGNTVSPNTNKNMQLSEEIKNNNNSLSSTTPIPSPERGGHGGVFTISDIVIGQTYDGYIKLQFNYGLFVTVKWVEWLLHKKELIVPDGVNRKKYFTIGDPIRVTAQEIKEINGEQRVVWSMKW